jgi:inorganic pyrophosphatase
MQSLSDVPKHKLKEISHFFETYKQLEKNKWAKVGGWHGAEEALKLVEDTHKMYLDSKAAAQKKSSK